MKLKKYAFGIVSGLALSGLLATTAVADTVKAEIGWDLSSQPLLATGLSKT